MLRLPRRLFSVCLRGFISMSAMRSLHARNLRRHTPDSGSSPSTVIGVGEFNQGGSLVGEVRIRWNTEQGACTVSAHIERSGETSAHHTATVVPTSSGISQRHLNWTDLASARPVRRRQT